MPEFKKSNVIASEDYELYTINLPFSVVLRRKCRKYIYSELGKLHPCFSEDWTFDSFLRPGKKGIEANVLVLEKAKLAEYKLKNSGKALRVDALENKRFFVSKKKKQFLFVCLVFSIVFLLFLAVVKMKNESRKEETQSEELSDLQQENVTMKTESSKKLCELAEELFSLIEEKNGALKKFCWKSYEDEESLNFVIQGIYPETVESRFNGEVKLLSVAFDGTVPVIQVAVNRFLSYDQKKLFYEEEINSEVRNYPKGLIRKILYDYGAEIKSESIEPYGLILCEKQKIFKNGKSLMEALAEEFEKDKVYLSELVIEKDSVELKFCKYNSGSAEILKLMNEYEKGIQSSKPVVVQKKGKEVKNKALVSGVKLGEVRHSDGSVFEYYKDEQGKIITRRIK